MYGHVLSVSFVCECLHLNIDWNLCKFFLRCFACVGTKTIFYRFLMKYLNFFQFLREELKYESGYEKRHKAFHHNDDLHISVKELWDAWLRSEVHNWTVDQTTEWLAQSVQLPQYVRIFRQHKVTGRVLPLLAVNNMHYVSTVLGIKDPIHKQKIALKAMDAVLFGPPRGKLENFHRR